MIGKFKNKLSDIIAWSIGVPFAIVVFASVLAVFALPILGVIWLCKAIF